MQIICLDIPVDETRISLFVVNICNKAVRKSVVCKPCSRYSFTVCIHLWGRSSCEFNCYFVCNLNSLGFSIFRPMGERVWSKCVQCFSLFSLMVIACRLLGGVLMNFEMVIFISLPPLWLWEL